MNVSVVDPLVILITERLKAIKPARIILFGSYAGGAPDRYSDIDLLVVLNNDHLPQNFREKSRLYLEVSRTIRDLRDQVPIDLIVHTRPMHQKFLNLNSKFSQEIRQKGIVLYEADHASVAQ
jgi:predicted nucleotidyltransferase